MYTLYYSPSSASFVVHWLLLELDLPHQLRRVDLASKQQKSAEYLALNPNGVVPTLLVDDQPVFECAAQLLYLADAHPQAGLAPLAGTVERAHYYQWVVHFANALLPTMRHWFYPAEAAGEAATEAAQACAVESISASWTRIDAHLAANGPYLLGEQLSAADFLLIMLMRWSRNLPCHALDWPALRALADRMRARESFKRVCEVEELTEWL